MRLLRERHGVHMIQNMYFENMFNSFLRGVENEKLIFIKYYNGINFDEEKINILAKMNSIDLITYHKFKKNDMKAPFEPFIDIIAELYRRYFSDFFSVQAFLKECGVYPLQVPAFVSYIEKGHAKRDEDALNEEGDYERQKAYESVIKCLKYAARSKKIVIVLDKFQYADLSTIRIVSTVLSELKEIEFKLFIAFNDKEKVKSYVSDEFINMIRIANEKKIVYEWHGYEIDDSNEVVSGFRPDAEHFGEYLDKLKNFYSLIAYEDADYYLNIMYVRIEEDKINITDEQKFSFYVLYSSNDIMMNNPKSALLHAEKLNSIGNFEGNYRKQFMYNYLCAQAHIFLIQNGYGRAYIDKCKEISEAHPEDEDLNFYAMLIDITSEYGGWHSIFGVDFEKLSFDRTKAKMLEGRGFYNVLARYYSYGSDNTSMEVSKCIENGMSENFRRAIEIGESLQNNNFLLSVNTKYISRYTDLGYYESAVSFYEQKLKILNKEGNKRRMANQMLGLGYNSMIAEDYQKAGEYFNSAVGILYELKKPEVIGEALYNLAMNSICAMDFESACKYLQLLFRILDHLNIETIIICNPSKLYGLLGLVYYHLGNEYKSYMNLSTMEVVLREEISDENKVEGFRKKEDMFYYHYLKGCLSIGRKDYKSAHEEFRRARKYYEGSPSVKACMVVCFMGDYFILLKNIEKDDEAFYVLQSAIDYCTEHKYYKKLEILQTIEEFGETVEGEKLPDFITVASEDEILEMAYNAGKENKLISRRKDIRFLSILQELIGKYDVEVDSLLENVMKLMRNNFDIDQTLFLEKDEKGEIQVLYKNEDMEIYVDNTQLFKYFSENNREFFINRIGSDAREYKQVIEMFNVKRMLTMVCIPVVKDKYLKSVLVAIINQDANVNGDMNLFENEHLSILKTATIQLMNAIERIRDRKRIQQINDRLNQMAITDMLTGLYNRQGFAKIIEQSENDDVSNAILYMDLDNFKYCNDTLGHDVGDLVLKCFSNVLKEVSSSKGYAVRYGGDEFIIVLNKAGKEEAIAVAEKIYEKIEDGFISEIDKHMNNKVDIPKEKRVTTSIGIAIAKDSKKETILDAIMNADNVLYSVKRNGKGKYMVSE